MVQTRLLLHDRLGALGPIELNACMHFVALNNTWAILLRTNCQTLTLDAATQLSFSQDEVSLGLTCGMNDRSF